jgi:hypothetical protein
MIVFAGLTVCALIVWMAAQSKKLLPAIEVRVDAEGSGGGMQVQGEDGYQASGSFTGGHRDGTRCSVSENYQVGLASDGSFAIQAHYIIDDSGARVELDRTIPVSSAQPDKAKWTKLQDHLWSYAYVSGTTFSK